jgi:hypothetical protein
MQRPLVPEVHTQVMNIATLLIQFRGDFESISAEAYALQMQSAPLDDPSINAVSSFYNEANAFSKELFKASLHWAFVTTLDAKFYEDEVEDLIFRLVASSGSTMQASLAFLAELLSVYSSVSVKHAQLTSTGGDAGEVAFYGAYAAKLDALLQKTILMCSKSSVSASETNAAIASATALQILVLKIFQARLQTQSNLFFGPDASPTSQAEVLRLCDELVALASSYPDSSNDVIFGGVRDSLMAVLRRVPKAQSDGRIAANIVLDYFLAKEAQWSVGQRRDFCGFAFQIICGLAVVQNSWHLVCAEIDGAKVTLLQRRRWYQTHCQHIAISSVSLMTFPSITGGGVSQHV